MVTCCDHQIIIDNLLQEDTVTFSLLLIKGHIIADNNNFVENSNNVINVQCSKKYSKWPLINKTFKCLVDLNSGYNKIILQYHQDKIDLKINYHPRNSSFNLTPLYIICRDHDGFFQAPIDCDNSIESACEKIALGTRLIQCLTAEKLYEHGYNRKTFQLESDTNVDSPKCFPFYSNLSVSEARNMEEEELWTYFGREIMTSQFGSSYRKYLAFLSCTEWRGTDEGEGEVKAHAALGGGGLALFGTGCLHTWPSKVEDIISCFLNNTLVDTRFLMDDSCHRGTYGACFSTTLGAVCHELGHTFDLGHCHQGIMGRGFDNIHLVFLASAPATTFGYNTTSVRRNTSQKSTVKFTNNLNVECSMGPPINRCHEMPSAFTQSKKKQTDSDNNLSQKHEDDQTHWSPSCAALLAFHRGFHDHLAYLVHFPVIHNPRWFNSQPDQSEDSLKKTLHFDHIRNILTGGSGIRVIELRGEDGMVLNSWQFPGTKRREQFFVPKQLVKNAQFLVSEDSEGNLIKLKLN